MDTLINMKNNLIQNFYIIGFSPEDFFYINEKNEGEFLSIFGKKNLIQLTPKIISKFPPNNSNFNEINDEIIINHCFPKGLYVKNETKTNPYFFSFELDNLLLNYSLEEKNIHSKIYFSCLRILESLDKYLKYKEEILSQLDNTIAIKDDNEDINKNLSNIYISKVICFASVFPCYHELEQILNFIYQNYLEQKNHLHLEKLIEQIVLKLPIPLNHELRIQLSLYSNKKEEKILFPIYNIKEENLKLYNTNQISLIFYFFNVDDVLKIFKYILLEIPILFFCEDKSNLTSIIESFISLLSPFKYVHPFISILPQKLYGFISVEKKFIFGIYETYNPNFFKKNEIEIDKNIVIVSIDKKVGKIDFILKENFDNNEDILIIKEEKSYDYNKKYMNNYNFVDKDCIIYNGTKTDLINVELPNEAKKNLSEKLSSYIKKINGVKEIVYSQEFNYKIMYYFYKFFVNILAGYTDYFLNSKYFFEAFSSKSCGFEVLFKKNKEKNISSFQFLKENFNFEEFVNKSDSPLFYFVFCRTKMFLNFMRERIYLNDKVNSMKYRQFDQICYLKKHKDHRKHKENKGIIDHFKKEEKYESKQYKINEIKVTKDDFNDFEKNQIINKDKTDILIKYAQNITLEKGKISQKYLLFPKLLFDDEFFGTKYDNIFFMHNIEMPMSKTIDNYKKICISHSVDYYKQRKYMFPPASLEQLPSTNNSKANFGVTSYYYIFYDWILLLCGSLWYCEPIERIIRLDDILNILDKLYYIEEIIVKLCFNIFLKYGNKMQCIQAYDKLMKFYGYSNYYYLNLLNNKLCQKEEVSFEEYINDKEYVFKERSLILNFASFIQKGKSKSSKLNGINNNNIPFRNTMYNIGMKNIRKSTVYNMNNKKESNYKEKIMFSSEQYCKKCKCYNSFDFEEIKKQKLSEINYRYKCIKCKTYKDDVIIKYQVLLFNKKRNELYITKMGEFKLLPPNRIYNELILKLISQKNWAINVDNLMNEEKNSFMNYLFYFSIEELTFDFLLPFNKLNDENVESIQNSLCSVLCDINKKRFSILGNAELNDINKGLIENTENENFIPIDISSTDNFDRYFELTPCVIEKEKGPFDGENNENIVDDENNNTNYFAINKEE